MKYLNLFVLFLAFASFGNKALAANRNYKCTRFVTVPATFESYADTMSLNFSDEGHFKISGQANSGEEFGCHGNLTEQNGPTRSGMIDEINSSACSFFGGKSIINSNNLGEATAIVLIVMADRRFHFKCVE